MNLLHILIGKEGKEWILCTIFVKCGDWVLTIFWGLLCTLLFVVGLYTKEETVMSVGFCEIYNSLKPSSLLSF